MPFDFETVHERNFLSGSVGCVSPVPRLQKHGVEQTHLKHFSSHSIDFHPVSGANAILAHQHKPPKETHNEIFQSHVSPAPARATTVAKLLGFPKITRRIRT